MKQTLILLSILLLSSPLFGDNHKGETLYRWETSNGIQWKGFGDKETHRQYKGEVENGKPNGLGIMISPYRDKYVGEWREGKPWNITIYGKSGIIIMKYVNGVEQK